MREITSHKVNGLNEALRIEVLDEPGAGGAFPRPCRSVCRGSGEQPKQHKDTPLWKDDPDQQARDFFEAARMELRIYGFAAAKQMAIFADNSHGEMQCPLCLQKLKWNLSSVNGHFSARCSTEGCIRAIE